MRPQIIALFLISTLCVAIAACCTGIFPLGSGSSMTQSPTIPPTTFLSQSASPGNNCSPVTITQTDGSEVTLPCHPQRIVVVNSNAAEMMIAIGAQDKIVGVTQPTTNVSYIMDQIPQAENIGDWQIPNVERILSLHPDVVIAYASSKPKNLDQFTAANITILYLDCFRLSTLASDARSLGKLTGRSNEAEVYARMVEDTIAEVTKRVKKIPGDAYPLVYSESYSDFAVSGPGSGADEMLNLAGGKNIASDVPASSAQISAEWVVTKKPEYIVKVISSTNTKPVAEILSSLKGRSGWSIIPAVQNDRVYVLANDIQFGPRSYIGLVYMAQILHTGEFRDMHPRQMLDDYAGRRVPGTNRTGMVYP